MIKELLFSSKKLTPNYSQRKDFVLQELLYIMAGSTMILIVQNSSKKFQTQQAQVLNLCHLCSTTISSIYLVLTNHNPHAPYRHKKVRWIIITHTQYLFTISIYWLNIWYPMVLGLQMSKATVRIVSQVFYCLVKEIFFTEVSSFSSHSSNHLKEQIRNKHLGK